MYRESVDVARVYGDIYGENEMEYWVSGRVIGV
jgi:hypothetical protein